MKLIGTEKSGAVEGFKFAISGLVGKTWIKKRDGHHTTPALRSNMTFKASSLAIRYEGRLLKDFS